MKFQLEQATRQLQHKSKFANIQYQARWLPEGGGVHKLRVENSSEDEEKRLLEEEIKAEKEILEEEIRKANHDKSKGIKQVERQEIQEELRRKREEMRKTEELEWKKSEETSKKIKEKQNEEMN